MELREYLDILRRHKWFIIESMVVVALAAGILSNLRTPKYQATAQVLLTPNDPTQQLNPTIGLGVVGDPDRYVTGQSEIAEGEAVAAEAVKSLPGVSVKLVESATSVSQSGQSNVLKISATDVDPVQARNIAEAVAKGYIENRRQAAVGGLQGAADEIGAKLGPLQTQIASLDSQIGGGAPLPGATSTPTGPVSPTGPGAVQPATQVPADLGSLGGAPTTVEALKAARYAAAVQYETLYSRQQGLVTDISLKRGDAELIADAKTPGSPISPHPKRDAALGAFVGLLLGVGISLLREQLNDRIRSAQEVERLTGLPLLAQLPYDEAVAKDRSVALAMLDRPNSPLGEAVRSLRTSIQYLGVDTPVKVVMVTSAAPGEGKSLVAANLAVAYAQADYRTLLISADLRRSSIDTMFGDLPPSPGLTGVLSPFATNGNGHAGHGLQNGQELDAIDTESLKVRLETAVPGLLLLPSGPTPPNPAELLGSRRMAKLLTAYGTQADVIIIDSPPLLPVTDAAVLAAKCDGVVLVTALNETRRDATTRARAILEGTGARILGVVVNKAPTSGAGGYYYAGYYGTNRDSEKKSTRRTDESPLGDTDVSMAAAGDPSSATASSS